MLSNLAKGLFQFFLKSISHTVDSLFDSNVGTGWIPVTRFLQFSAGNDVLLCTSRLLYHNLAKGLVMKARGEKSTGGFWQMASNWSDTTPNNNQMASGDDITCLALPIAKVTQFLK